MKIHSKDWWEEGGASCIFCPGMDAKPLEDAPILYEIVWVGGGIYGSR